MNIKSAEFEISAQTFAQVKATVKNLPQVAFVGRSNVGKSSLINMLCARKNMAITSSTPGRTRLINFFRIESSDGEIYFVDLPGYGFASAAKNATDGWNQDIGTYLTQERNLKLVFIVLDVRIKPTEKDIQCIQFLQSNGIPFAILGSKADKLSRSELGVAGRKLAQELGVGESDVIITSSVTKAGRESVLKKLFKFYKYNPKSF